MHDIRPGAYYTYTRDEWHCREGLFFADQDASGAITLRDTFWDVRGSREPFIGHNRPSDNEQASIEFYFHPADSWREANTNDIIAHFRADDVRRVTTQHGHYSQVWIREGATPDYDVIIELRRAEVEEARYRTSAARRAESWAKEQLQRAIAAKGNGDRAP